KAVTLAPGETSVPIDVTFDKPGSHAVDAVLTTPGDPLPANDHVTTEIVVDPPPKVLYVEGATASASYLERALAESGLNVTTGGRKARPATRESLAPWDAVILSDVARADIPDAAMNALGEWVEHDGGGLLVAGGEAVFGESAPGTPGGYRNTEIERLTPV